MADLVNDRTPRVSITATHNSPIGSAREDLFETHYNSGKRDNVINAIGD